MESINKNIQSKYITCELFVLFWVYLFIQYQYLRPSWWTRLHQNGSLSRQVSSHNCSCAALETSIQVHFSFESKLSHKIRVTSTFTHDMNQRVPVFWWCA